MIDIVQEIDAARRAVGAAQLPGGAARTVRLGRDFDAPIEDVWDAITNLERIGRWFLPITADARIGGRYQLEGNAGGEILACERPERLKVTWEYGAPADETNRSEVEIRLARIDDGRTRFELEHVAIVPDEFWDQFGPGAVGVGWDGGLLGLTLHLRHGQEAVGDPIAWQTSDEGRAFNRRSAAAWGEAQRAAGADDETVARAVAGTIAFYAPDPEATG